MESEAELDAKLTKANSRDLLSSIDNLEQALQNKIVPRRRKGPLSTEQRKAINERVKKIKTENKIPRGLKAPTTIKYRRLAKHWIENGMKDLKSSVTAVGFSEKTSISTITKTKTWKEIMEEYFPDTMLADRHKELLNKREYRRGPDGEWEDIGPETSAVAKSLEMAYKLKGSFKESTEQKPNTAIYNLFYKPEVREEVKAFEESLKQRIFNEANKYNKKNLDGGEGETITVEPDNDDE